MEESNINVCKHELTNDKQGMYICYKCGISLESIIQDGKEAEELDKANDTPQVMPGDAEKYREYIRAMSFLDAKKNFDFDDIFKFCQDHRVEVMMQEDAMFHCFIDWHLPEGKGSWAIEFDSFTAFILGIKQYIEHGGKGKQEAGI